MGSYSNRLTSKQSWDKRYWSAVWQKRKQKEALQRGRYDPGCSVPDVSDRIRPWKNLDRGTPHRPASASGGGTSGFPAPFGVPCGGMYHPGGMETKKNIIRWGDSPFLRIKPVKKTE